MAEREREREREYNRNRSYNCHHQREIESILGSARSDEEEMDDEVFGACAQAYYEMTDIQRTRAQNELGREPVWLEQASQAENDAQVGEQYPLVLWDDAIPEWAYPPPSEEFNLLDLRTFKLGWSLDARIAATGFEVGCMEANSGNGWIAYRHDGSDLWGLKYNPADGPSISYFRQNEGLSGFTKASHLSFFFSDMITFARGIRARIEDAFRAQQLDNLKADPQLTALAMGDGKSSRKYVASLMGFSARELDYLMERLRFWEWKLRHGEVDQVEKSRQDVEVDANWINRQILSSFGIDEKDVRPLHPDAYFRMVSSAHLYLAMTEIALCSHASEHVMSNSDWIVAMVPKQKRMKLSQCVIQPGQLYFHPVPLSVLRSSQINPTGSRYGWVFSVWEPDTRLPRDGIAISAAPDLLMEIWSRRAPFNGELFHPSCRTCIYAFGTSLGLLKLFRGRDGWDASVSEDEVRCRALRRSVMFARKRTFPPRDSNGDYPYRLFIA